MLYVSTFYKHTVKLVSKQSLYHFMSFLKNTHQLLIKALCLTLALYILLKWDVCSLKLASHPANFAHLHPAIADASCEFIGSHPDACCVETDAPCSPCGGTLLSLV